MADKKKDRKDDVGGTVPGFAVLGGLTIGVVAGAAGLLAALSSDFSGAGVCFAAAALAFGLVANAVYRR